MAQVLSPGGIAGIAVLVIIIALLVYRRRKSIRRWLRRQEVSEIELGGGPIPFTVKLKKKPERKNSSAGVDFGESGDFTGAKFRNIAGRDIRRGSTDARPPGGRSPGVNFGKKGRFRDAEIEEVAGRDLVED
jgi:hypothetical protein